MNSTFTCDLLCANRRSDIHLYPDDWKQLPIPDAPPEKQAPIVALVEQILAAKKSPPAPLSEGGSENKPHFNKGGLAEGRGDLPLDIPVLEAEIDRLVYALYNLTDEEIAVVEGKQ
jgi:adenine-specific DNA-methyltransferase